jgi:hypothetical protein
MTKEKVSDDRLRNTRAWAAARLGQLSGAEVIVAACDEALAARTTNEAGSPASNPLLFQLRRVAKSNGYYDHIAPFDAEIERLQSIIRGKTFVTDSAHEPPDEQLESAEPLASYLEDRIRTHADDRCVDISMGRANSILQMLRDLQQFHDWALPQITNPPQSAPPPVPELPEELFDGHAVWLEAGNVQSQDVTRVLDAIVKLIRKRQSRPTKAGEQS